MSDPLQDACERGQEQLMQMDYLAAERTLARAEHDAWMNRDWDTLARLYMPLQEARRQRRQRAGEGVVCLDLFAENASDHLDARHIIEYFPHGQLLVAGWGTIAPALAVRELAIKHDLYLDTFLAAAYPTDAGRVAVIVPLADTRLPEPIPRSIAELRSVLPGGCLVLSEADLPRGSRRGTYETYGHVMNLWEDLHEPILADAERQNDLVEKMSRFRATIEVDYACELAHQHLSDAARKMMHRT